MIYAFGDYALDTQLYELRHLGQPCPLGPQAFNVLIYLIQHRDRVVTKDELIEHLWPVQSVSDATLHQHVTAARRAVGDNGRVQRVIQTLRGRGYRFIAPIASHSDAVRGRDVRDAPEAADHATQQTLEPTASTSLPLSTALAAERKLVTVLGGTLVNAVTLAETLGFEALRRLRQAFLALVQQAVQPYHGTLQSMGDDGFWVLFGMPVAQEDHAKRAVLAGLALQRRLREPYIDPVTQHDVAFAVCLGVHTGPVMVGRNTSDVPQSTATVMGEVTTVVVQLQQRTTPGMLSASEDTLRLVSGDVHSEACGSISMPGWPAPLRVYTIHAIDPRQASGGWQTTRPLSRFVDRERDMSVLHALLAQAEQGQGHVVGIVGEPGLGKSRLLYEFAQLMAEKPVTYVEGHCLSYANTTPYLPVLDLLRQLCGITDTDDPETIAAKVHRCLGEVGDDLTARVPYVLQLLGVLADSDQLADLDPKAIKNRTFETLRQLIVQRSRQQPLILVVENLHWIDPTSEEWLASLVDGLAPTPLLLLTTYRPGYRPLWMDKSYATQWALSRLTPAGSLAVLRAVPRTTPLAEPLVQEILTKAAGNPFFIEELTRAVVERGDDLPGLPVPETIQAVLASRIDRLAVSDKRVLQVASVIGKDMSFSLLQAVVEMPEAVLEQSLRHLQMEEFLYAMPSAAGPVYTFKHALTQDVAYQSLLKTARQQVHGRIAQVLVARFPETVETQPERLAQHYTEAGLPEPAVAYWQQAGKRAVERAAYAEAVSHFRKGLKELRTLPDTPNRTQQELHVQIALGNALIATKGWGAADVECVFLRAYDLCHRVDEISQLFSVLNRLCNLYVVRGSVQTAREYGEQLLRLSQRLGDTECLGVSHASFGEVLLNLGAFAQAREHLVQARAYLLSQSDHAYTGDFDRLHGQIRCHTMMMRVLWMLGYPDQALAISQKALTFAQEVRLPFVLAIIRNYAAVLHVHRGEGRQAQHEAENVLVLATEHGFPQWKAAGTLLRGWALAVQGRVGDGIEQMRQGLTAVRMAGSEVAQAGRLTNLVNIYSKVGYAMEGLQLLNEAQAIAHATGGLMYEAEFHRLRGELLRQLPSDESAKAETYFLQAMDVAKQQQAKSWELRAATSLSRLWKQQGKLDEARQLLADVYGWFTEGFDTADLQEAKALLKELGG